MTFLNLDDLVGDEAVMLHHLAVRQPLLLMLDDLQWVDGASINLLFHLGRRLPGNRILILGAYRLSEVALGQFDAGHGKERLHPLKPMVNEITRHFGDIRIDLDQMTPAEGRAFVDALLDREPNRLEEAFRATMFQRTKGYPLLTVELLRDMQERGDLLQDQAGYWVEGPALAWDTLPVRVEAVIEQRLGRLETKLRDILTIASVEGEQFTAEVIAHKNRCTIIIELCLFWSRSRKALSWPGSSVLSRKCICWLVNTIKP